MEIAEHQHGAVTVVRPNGALTKADCAEFEQSVRRVLQRSLGRFVVDVSGLTFVDSAGLETLLTLSEALADRGHSLRLCAENETFREVLEITELSMHFEHYHDLNSAVRSFL